MSAAGCCRQVLGVAGCCLLLLAASGCFWLLVVAAAAVAAAPSTASAATAADAAASWGVLGLRLASIGPGFGYLWPVLSFRACHGLSYTCLGLS